VPSEKIRSATITSTSYFCYIPSKVIWPSYEDFELKKELSKPTGGTKAMSPTNSAALELCDMEENKKISVIQASKTKTIFF